MLIDFIAETTTWVVITSTDPTQLLRVEVGLQFTSWQTCSVFTDEAVAIEYAIEHGWQPQPDEQQINIYADGLGAPSTPPPSPEEP